MPSLGKKNLFLVLFLGLCLTGPLAAQEVRYYEDKTGNLGWEEAYQRRGEFGRLDGSAASFGYTASAYWFLIETEGARRDGIEKVLNFQNIHLDYLKLVFLDEEGRLLAEYDAGDAVPHDERLPYGSSYLFKLPPVDPLLILVRIESTNAVIFHPVFGDFRDLDYWEKTNFFLLGILTGVLLLMLFYNVLMYKSTRDGNFLWYCFYLFATLVFQLEYTGLARFLWFLAPNLQNWIDIPALAFQIFAYLVFATKVNNLRDLRGFRWYLGFLYLGLALGLGLFLFGLRRPSLVVLNLELTLLGFSFFVLILIQALRGLRFSRYFIFAWTVLLFSGVYSSFASFGVLGNATAGYYVLAFGHFIELGLLSWAMSDRVRSMQGTIRRQSEKLGHLDRLAALGTLSAKVGHEVSNANHVVSLNVGLLDNLLLRFRKEVQRAEEDGETLGGAGEKIKRLESEGAKSIESLRRASGQIKEILDNMRYQAVPGADDEEVRDLRELVDELVAMQESRIRLYTKAFHYERAESPLRVKCRPLRFQQLVVNLLGNSLQALTAPQQSVKIVLGLEAASAASASRLNARGGERPGVFVEIADEGRGMGPETLRKLGEPFFTTRGGEGGTGLGWSICRDIVKELGGRIELDSEEGRGTRVRIVFPQAL